MKTLLRNFIGVFVFICFWLSNFAGIQIPKEMASVKEFSLVSTDVGSPLILHIQTAHGNYEAQLRVRELLKLLHDKYGFNTFFVEGASGVLNPDFLRFFPKPELNLQFAEALARQGQLTGAEYYLVDAPPEVQAVGIEEPGLYRKGLQAYQAVNLAEDKTQPFSDSLAQEWNRLASSMLSKEMRQMLSEWKKFHVGNRDAFPYIKKLANEAKKTLNLDMDQLSAQLNWPQITRSLVLQRISSDLNHRLILKDRRRFLHEWWDKKCAPEFLVFLQKKDSKLTRANLQKFFQDTSKEILLADYPWFSQWLGLKILEGELDSEALFQEVDMLWLKIMDKLLRTEEERELLEMDRDLHLLKKVFSLELSRKDWQRTQARKDLLEPAKMAERLSRLGSKIVEASNLSAIFSTAFQFYDVTEKREDIFDKIISKEMQNSRIQKAVLVTGGFHSSGMQERLRKKGIQYELLTPRFKKDKGILLYRDAMLEKTPTAFDLSTMEETAKMLDHKKVLSLGRSSRSETRVVTFNFIEIAKQAKNIQELKASWGLFSNSPYAKDRGIRVEPLPEVSPEKLSLRLLFPDENFEIIFSPTPSGFGYGMRSLGRNQKASISPEIVLPLTPSSRSETRTEVFYRHIPVTTDPEGDHVNVPSEWVDLAPLGIGKWLSYVTPFEARIIQAFLHGMYEKQPRAVLQSGQAFIYPAFEGRLTGLEAATFVRTLHEVQEEIKRERGNLDQDAVTTMMEDLYWARVNKYDHRTPVLPISQEVLDFENKIWRGIFEGLIKKILQNRTQEFPEESLGVIQLLKKKYIQVLPGTTFTLEFLPGKFPRRGISVILDDQKVLMTVKYRQGAVGNNTWLIRYGDDPTQDVVFPSLGGVVSIGTDPVLYNVERQARVIVPRSTGVAPSHAAIAVLEQKGILKIQVSDGGFDYGTMSRKPSGGITLLEYPNFQRIHLPLLRSEVRAQETFQSGKSFSPPDFSKFDGLSVELQIISLTRGITKISSAADLKLLKRFSRLQSDSVLPALQRVGKVYPVTRSSEAPGALVLVTDKLPTTSELVALRSLLLSQKNEYLRIALPEQALTRERVNQLKSSVQEVFDPVKDTIGRRFDWVVIKERKDLNEIPRDIYQTMKEKGLPIQKVQDLQSKYLVQWFDEGVTRHLDISASLDPYAKIMRSNLENESLYSQLRVWGAAHAMKISQGVSAQEVDRTMQAFQEQGRFIQFRVTDALRGLVEGFMQVLQVSLRIAQSA